MANTKDYAMREMILYHIQSIANFATAQMTGITVSERAKEINKAVTGGTGTCHTSDFAFDICVKSIFHDITFSAFAYVINKKVVSLQMKYG